MEHINYARRVHSRRNYSMRDFLSNQAPADSFAAFGGSQAERESAALYGIARACGHRGVVILHDDPHFDARLSELRDLNSGNYQVYSANRPGAYIYDPLYGMDEAAVLDAVFYYESASTAVPVLMQQQEAVRDYLRIMEIQFRTTPAPFGESAYNLDLLQQLTRMPYSELDARVLAYLPANMAVDIRGRLSAPNVQQSAWNAVANFASLMQGAMWTPHAQWQQHSRRSIASTVQQGQVISLRLPGSDARLLRMAAADLESLLRAGRSFLLVCYGLRVQGCPAMENLLFNNRANCSVGVVAQSLSAVSTLDRAQPILENYNQVVVFQCRSAIEAETFSAALGSYYRVIHPEQRGRQRPAFRLIPMLSHNRTHQESVVRNVRPEDLMSGRTLLCGRRQPIATLVDRMEL